MEGLSAGYDQKWMFKSVAVSRVAVDASGFSSLETVTRTERFIALPTVGH